MLGIRNISVIQRKPNSNWWDKMWASYVQLNPGTYSNAVATEFKNRCKPDYIENLVPNGGGVNATDWVDSNSDGLADSFSATGGTTSIVTGNGFTGNAQKIVSTGTNALIYTTFSFPTGVLYTITFKHRSNSGIAVNPMGAGILQTFPANIGTAKQETIVASVVSSSALLVFYCKLIGSASVGDWIEIDEITVTPTTTQNYFTIFGPTGLNKTTADWIYLLTSSGNITSRTITKSGNSIKWNLDGVTVTQNSLPAYTKDANTGIVTMASTDGWGGVTSFGCYTNNFNGLMPNVAFNNLATLNAYGNAMTRSGSAYISTAIRSVNYSGNVFTTAGVDAELKAYHDYFAIYTPTGNLTLNLSGATMGIPTGGANNSDLLSIMALFSAAGFTATIIIRTS